MDSRIQKGTLGSGVRYYMVTDPAVKGYADIAIVQRDEPLSAAKRKDIDSDFFARMSIAPGPEGYITDVDGSTVYQFTHVPFYKKTVLDSTMLYTFSLVAKSRAQQAVIVSGDIDAPELKKKMDIFSMLVPRMLVKENHTPDYIWEPSPAPSVRFCPGMPAYVQVSYATSRVPFPYMNTAQALVTDLFGDEYEVLLRHRLERNFSEAALPYSGISFDRLRSSDHGGDERYTVRVGLAPQDLDAGMRIIATTLAQMDTYGVTTEEFVEAKQVLLPDMHKKNDQIPLPGEYVSRCIANFLYGANLTPFSQSLHLFTRKNVPDSTETRLFNTFASALLEQLSNLTLEYKGVTDSLDKDEELFYYNLSYLYGSVVPPQTDYSWRGADTLGLDCSCPKVKIKKEKQEALTGGTVWTLSNGMRVVYKQTSESDIFHYALQLNGGLALIDDLQPGEGGYIGEMLSLYDVGGLPAWHFREVLQTHGLSMETKVDLNSLSIQGGGPSSEFVLLLKSFLQLANQRSFNEEEFAQYCRREQLRTPSRRSEMNSRVNPSYVYTTDKDPAALTPETWKKAEHYFANRLSRMNDGVLILSGDLGADVVKKMLCRYLGGFQVSRTTAARKQVDFRPRSGTLNYTASGEDKGLHILLDAEYALTADHFYTAQVGAEALRQLLVQRLSGYGFSCEVSLEQKAHPQERCQIWIDCRPLPLSSLPADVTEVSSQRALTAIRAALREASRLETDPADLALWKSKLGEEVKQVMATSEGFANTLLVRYALNKDITSRYQESITGISNDKVKDFLKTMAGGACVECIVP